MEWLLKIVEGPMKGAEIALVAGSRVKVGSGDDCDIVISDLTLPEVACELDVSESSVTRIGTDGEAKELAPFTVVAFGATAFAVGPAAGAWEELKRPEPVKAADTVSDAGADTVPDASRVAGDTVPEAPTPRGVGAEGGEKGSSKKPARHHGYLVGILVFILFLLVLVILAWFFWPKIVERYPKVEEIRVTCVEKVTAWLPFKQGRQDAAPTRVAAPTLADIATTHGLVLTNYPLSSVRYPLLKGNVKRRTERLAIRALALAADPTVKFDLTDDESLCASANELLFVVTEGQLKATGASNRVVTVCGYAPSAASLERTIRALNADVPGIERLLTAGVQVGGVPPKAKDPLAPVIAVPETPRLAGADKKPVAVPDYPIAGLLTKPYPCVVMRNGLRLTEGAQIGSVVIEKIEVDKLTLRDGKTTIVWKP